MYHFLYLLAMYIYFICLYMAYVRFLCWHITTGRPTGTGGPSTASPYRPYGAYTSSEGSLSRSTPACPGGCSGRAGSAYTGGRSHYGG